MNITKSSSHLQYSTNMFQTTKYIESPCLQRNDFLSTELHVLFQFQCTTLN